MKRTLALCFLIITLASGATAASASPVAPEAFDVTLHEEGGRSILIVSGKLPEGTTLPADITLTAPSDWEVQWAGEILGGDLSEDIPSEPAKKAGEDFDTYTLTLTKSLEGQLEISGPPSIRFDGTTYTGGLTWTPPVAADQVRVSMALPANAKVASGSEGARFVPVDATGGYYTKTFTNVKADAPLELAVSYSAAVAAPTAANSSSPVGAIVVVVVALVLFAGAFLAVRRKMATGAGGVPDDAADDGEDLLTAIEAEPLPGEELAVDAAGDDDDVVEPAVPARRSKLPIAIVVGVLGVLVVFGFMAGSRSSATQAVNGVVSRTFAGGDACTQASIAISPQQGVDLEKSAEDILTSLETIPGVTTAALYVEESRIEIGYCASSSNEEQLRQALAASGLVTVD